MANDSDPQVASALNRRSVPDVLPHFDQQDPWVLAAELHRIVREAPIDPGLIDDLAEIRDAELNDRGAERSSSPRSRCPESQ